MRTEQRIVQMGGGTKIKPAIVKKIKNTRPDGRLGQALVYGSWFSSWFKVHGSVHGSVHGFVHGFDHGLVYGTWFMVSCSS